MTKDFRAFEEFSMLDWGRPSPITFIRSHVPDAPNSHYLFLDLSALNNGLSGQETLDRIISSTGNQAPAIPAMSAEQTLIAEQMKAALFYQITTNRALNNPLNVVNPFHVLDRANSMNDFSTLSEHVDNEWLMSIPGGGFSDNKYGIVAFSAKQTVFDKVLDESLQSIYGYEVSNSGFTGRERGILNQFVLHHEAAHNMLGLREAGSDFMAAATILRNNPSARDVIQLNADLRNISWTDENDSNVNQHGAECHDAINHALNIDPDTLRRMSTEDLYNIARGFDDMTSRNALDPNSAEKVVTRRPDGQNTDIWGIFFGQPLQNAFQLASVNAETYRQGSPADRLIESMLESAGRLKERMIESPVAQPFLTQSGPRMGMPYIIQ